MLPHPNREVRGRFQGMKSGSQGNRPGTTTIRKTKLPFPKPVAPVKPKELVTQTVKTSDGKVRQREFEIGKFLGKGGFARVYEAKCRSNNQKYAAKIIAKSSLTKRRAKEKLISEIKIHRKLNHENVVKFHTHFEDRENVYIMLELCEQQTMMQLLKARKSLPEDEARRFMLQTITGMEYLHKRMVIHRDLKLGNLMLDKGMNIKIGDFGLAAQLEEETDRRKTICGTPNYIAPEILNKCEHSFEVDVWSLGVIFYTLLVGRPAFESTDVKTTYKRIKGNTYSFPPGLVISEEAKDLIAIMLSPDPSTRPTLDAIKAHPFFNADAPSIPRKRSAEDVLEAALPPKRSRPALLAVPGESAQSTTTSARRTARRALEVYPSATAAVHSKPLLAGSAALPKPLEHPVERDRRRSTVDIIHDALHRSFARKDLEITGETPHKENVLDNGPEMVALTQPSVWLRKWVDFRKKYGVGYMTNLGSYGAYFNDGTKIVLAAQGMAFDYITSERDGPGKSTRYTLEDFPTDLEKKVNLLQHFQDYLEMQEGSFLPPFSLPDRATAGKANGEDFAFVEKFMQTKLGKEVEMCEGARG